MISRAIAELAVVGDVEEPYFRTPALVAVADHDDSVTGHEHLVVPGAVWIDVRPEGVGMRDWPQRAITDSDGEKTSATQHDEVIPMYLDDAAFVDACVLRVCY